MDMDDLSHRLERDEHDASPVRHHRDDDSKHSRRDKDRKNSSRGEDRDRDHRSKDKERSKKVGDDIDKERSKDRSKDAKVKDKDHDRDKSRDKERERDRERKERSKEKDRETRDRDRDRDREKERERTKEKEREKEKDKYKDRDNDRDRDREKARDRPRERETDTDKGRSRERERVSKSHEEDLERSKDELDQMEYEEDMDEDSPKPGKQSFHGQAVQNTEVASGGTQVSTADLEDRILKMKQERAQKKSEGGSEILSWVSQNRKIEDKRKAEKEKAKQLSKIFEEQDNIGQGEESEEEDAGRKSANDLAGVKVLHGLEKVMEGGAVVLTLKDQSILADGGLNEEIDMLENVEIGEQKQRDDAYKAAKKKTGIDDKFNEDPSGRKILPQYDDTTTDEGVTLDERGGFTGEAEKKLEELRKRLEAPSLGNRYQDLTTTGKVSTEYYTQEEMLKFKKPKKKKSLRKKDKLDLDALEAEAVSAGLGAGDLGSRSDGRRKAAREEQERSEAEKRNSAYQLAYAKADEASKSLRLAQTLPTNMEEDENSVFADDDEYLYKSLERARKLALKKQEEDASGPQAIARLAASTSTRSTDDPDAETAESQENKVVFTEMKEFVWGLQLGEESNKPESEDVFKDEDEAPSASVEESKDEAGGWLEADDNNIKEENAVNNDEEEMVPDETIHEVAVGKGLSGALKLLKERGTLKETVEWGGRNMDKKKSKLVGIVDDDTNDDANGGKFKDIRIERTDEFGRILTPKEAFRLISHKFHGKGPGKMKQEKRMKQYEQELKLKQMKNSDTPSQSVERMREAQAQLKTPYLVLSGHVKPGQTSDPRSGFATVEKEIPGGLTPMLGDKKVEHFLGIKRKAEPGNNSGTPKKPKT